MMTTGSVFCGEASRCISKSFAVVDEVAMLILRGVENASVAVLLQVMHRASGSV